MASRRRTFKAAQDLDHESDSEPVEPLDRDQQEQVVNELIKEAKAGDAQWNAAAGGVQALLLVVTILAVRSPLSFPLLHLISLPPLLGSAALSLLPTVHPELAATALEQLPFPPLCLLYPPLAAAVLGMVLTNSWLRTLEWAIPLVGVALGLIARDEGRKQVAEAEAMRAKMYGYAGA